MTEGMDTKRLLLIDNYDSFTYNLYDYFLQLGASCMVVRNDAYRLEQIQELNFDALVLSPGPKKPWDAGIMMNIVQAYFDRLPILGICLGHQGLGEFFGAELSLAKVPMHGKTSLVYHDGQGIFSGIPNPTRVMRYHSLILKQLPRCLLVNARTSAGEVMGFRHRKYSIIGMQYHPESILSSNGMQMLRNWLARLDLTK